MTQRRVLQKAPEIVHKACNNTKNPSDFEGFFIYHIIKYSFTSFSRIDNIINNEVPLTVLKTEGVINAGTVMAPRP
jgi:hypothetical protein